MDVVIIKGYGMAVVLCIILYGHAHTWTHTCTHMHTHTAVMFICLCLPVALCLCVYLCARTFHTRCGKSLLCVCMHLCLCVCLSTSLCLFACFCLCLCPSLTHVHGLTRSLPLSILHAFCARLKSPWGCDAGRLLKSLCDMYELWRLLAELLSSCILLFVQLSTFWCQTQQMGIWLYISLPSGIYLHQCDDHWNVQSCSLAGHPLHVITRSCNVDYVYLRHVASMIKYGICVYLWFFSLSQKCELDLCQVTCKNAHVCVAGVKVPNCVSNPGMTLDTSCRKFDWCCSFVGLL